MIEFTSEQIARIAARLGKDVEGWLRENSVEKLYSTEALAELFDVTKRTIENYVEEGERTQGRDGIYPVIKLSHKVVRVRASVVNRFLNSRTVIASKESAA